MAGLPFPSFVTFGSGADTVVDVRNEKVASGKPASSKRGSKQYVGSSGVVGLRKRKSKPGRGVDHSSDDLTRGVGTELGSAAHKRKIPKG